MKSIKSSDLKILLFDLNIKTVFSDSIDKLLDEYDDDWSIEDGCWVKTFENPKMKDIREKYNRSRKG